MSQALASIAAPPGLDTADIPAHATGVVLVDVAQVAANWRALARLVAPAECAAVVKADAYGLGSAAVIPALVAAGCKTLFVATAEEAEAARRLAPRAIVYVLDGLLDAGFLARIGARPVLSDEADIGRWEAHRARAGNADHAALQVDTGLNRLGLPTPALERLAAKGDLASRLGLTLIMSHLACADEASHPMNAQQQARFVAARGLLPAIPASLAASDGLMLGETYHFDLVRPGYALYGGQASSIGAAPVKPAVRALARILQVREVPAGESIGYAASFTTRAPRLIATIAAGYADGIDRHASAGDGEDRGQVVVAGRRCPIVGRVSMDLVTVDVTEAGRAATLAGAAPLTAGGWAELIGPTLTLEEVGARAATIGYEVLTRLGRRFHRIHTGGIV